MERDSQSADNEPSELAEAWRILEDMPPMGEDTIEQSIDGTAAVQLVEEDEGDQPMTQEELRESIEQFKRDQLERAPVEVSFWADDIKSIELNFAKQLRRSEERGEALISEKEFLIWESDYRDDWERIQGQVRLAHVSMAEEAKAEAPMVVYTREEDLRTTVEAQAGVFFAKRARELAQAGGGEAVQEFTRAVDKHLDFKYMGPDEVRDYGYEDYERGRTIAHNNAIKALNKLNQVADNLGTTRFTPRDFWTSEVQQQTPDMSRRMRFDRDIVEEYYALAFSAEVKRREAKQRRDMMFY
jgi:hypothetical protein